jgi:hypothetical protein
VVREGVVPYGLVLLAELSLLVYCLLDVIRTPATHVRNLPKPVWAILCFVPPVIGPIAWLLFGRPPAGATTALPYKGNPGVPQEPWVSPRRRASQSPPDDDEAFLRALRERAEEQRRAAEQQRRERERERDDTT